MEAERRINFRLYNFIPYFRFERYKIIIKSRFTDLFERIEDEKGSKGSLSPTTEFQLFQENLKHIRAQDTPIIPENILAGYESKTTAFIKNIPKKYRITDLIELLNKKNIKHYDMIYFPFRKKNFKSFGFAFINFTHNIHILDFYQKFHNKTFDKSTFEIYYAHTQGYNKLKKRCSRKYLYDLREIANHFN